MRGERARALRKRHIEFCVISLTSFARRRILSRRRRQRRERGAIWVQPKLVAQVNFATWTADNLVRQASFKGLREDKPAAEVRREEPKVAPRQGSSASAHRMQAPLRGCGEG